MPCDGADARSADELEEKMSRKLLEQALEALDAAILEGKGRQCMRPELCG
jgi:hypothetical protein